MIKMTTKAYSVTTSDRDYFMFVWTNGGRAKAKYIVHKAAWFMDWDWVDLICIREPKADGERIDGYCFDSGWGEEGNEDNDDDLMLLRNIGDRQYDGKEQCCKVCYKYEWDGLQRSVINSDDGVCVECRENGY